MSSFFVTGGTLRADAPSYVERRADHQLYQGLMASDFCYVLTSRQMGKSSLMVRTANRLRAVGVRVVVLDLTAVGQNVTPEQWYYGLLLRTGDHLKLQDALDKYWESNAHLGPCQRFFSALRCVALDAVSQDEEPPPPEWAAREAERKRLVIFVDEIDVVKSVTFSTDEFFAAIRECYNRRTEDLEFCRITFCLLGVAMPSELIRDTRLTPFNIGRRIELTDFTADEVVPLSVGLQGSDRIGSHPSVLNRVLYWTGGHPYLTQRLCQSLSGQDNVKTTSVDSACSELFFSSRASERDDNLIFVRERLLRNDGDVAGLLTLYQRVLRRKRVPDDDTNTRVSTLRLSGVVRSEDGQLVSRNRIYRQVFNTTWTTSHMPDADVRRQQAAYRLGVLRATAISVAIILIFAGLMVTAIKQGRQAQRASGLAFVSQAEATLVSGFQGQRFKPLAAIRAAEPMYTNKAVLRNIGIAALALPDLRLGQKWSGWPDGTTCVAIANDFEIYARGNETGTITVRDTRTDTETAAISGRSRPLWVGFTPDGSLLAAIHGDTLVVWNWRKKQKILEVPAGVSGTAVDFSPSGREIAVGMADGSIEIHALRDSEGNDRPVIRLAPEDSRRVTQLRFHPFAPRLAVCSIPGLYVRIWDLGTRSITNLLFHSAQTLSLAWHPDGEILAGGSTNGAICLWNVNARQALPVSQGASMRSGDAMQSPQRPWKVLDGHEADVLRLAFTHSGNLLASFGADKALCLWCIATGRQMTHSPESADVETLAFSKDDRRLGIYRSDSELQIWEVNTAAAYRPLLDPTGVFDEITQIDFSSKSDTLAVATSRGTVLWDAITGRRLDTLASAPVRSVFFDRPSGDLLTCSSEGLRRFPLDKTDNSSGHQLCSKNHVNLSTNLSLPENLGKMALSRDGKTLAILVSQALVIFNPGQSDQPKQLAIGTFCDAVALSPDGTFVAVRERGKDEIQIWDTKQQSRISAPIVIKAGPNFCFSPDGKWFCAVTGGEYVAWQIPGWTKGPRLPRKRSANQPGVVAFSPDSSTLAIGITPSTIQLVRIPGGNAIGTLQNPDRRPVVNMAFNRDGRRLAAAAREGLVVLWDLAVVAEELSELGLRGELPAFSEKPPKASSGAQIEIHERKSL